MLRTLDGWRHNGMDKLSLVWSEPLTWIILVGAIAWAVWHWTSSRSWTISSAVAYAGGVAWLIATLAITIYPINTFFDAFPSERFEIESVVPLAGTIQSLGHMRDRTRTAEDHEALTAKLADDLGIPPEEVNLPWQIRGSDPTVVLRDPLLNILLFVPGGLLVASVRGVSWRRTALAAMVMSGGIEAAQLFLGLGSLGTIDDVIFNTVGALVGFNCYRLARRLWQLTTRPDSNRDLVVRQAEAGSR